MLKNRLFLITASSISSSEIIFGIIAGAIFGIRNKIRPMRD